MSIALTTHKVAAVLLALSMVFSVAFVTPASAATVEELTAQINSLLATIAGLQAQLGGLTGGSTTTGGASCAAFTLSHKQGDTGGEVMAIQKFLNANGFTIAASGAGSPGNESSYFGSLTKSAVMKFQAAKGVAPVAGYWGPLTRAAANSMCTGTGTGTGTGTTVPTGTGITVTAAAQPGNSLAPKNARRVPFTKFVLTNNSATVQTVNGVTVMLGGLASEGSFDSVVLLDANGIQIGNERVINSNRTVTLGEAWTMQPGQSQTLTIAANIKNAPNNGEVASFSVTAINTGATVSGSLPITGAQHTINSTLTIGQLTAVRGPENPGADETEEIGTTDEKFTAIKLTAGSEEDVRLWSIRFDQSGSASASDLANVKAWVDGVSYPMTVMGDYYTVSFPGGIVIQEGLSKEVVVSGDIVNGTNRTIAFDIRKDTDIYATGETYGYGVKADDGNTTVDTGEAVYDDERTPTFDGYDFTILAGTFNSVTKSAAAPAADITTQKTEELLGAFTVDLKGEGIQVQTLKMDIVTVGTNASTARKITNVKLVDQNGVVLGGPVDSTTLAANGATNTDALTFSNVEFNPGVTTLFVRGQLNSSWGTGDSFTLQTQPSTDWTDAQGITTGDNVDLPSALAITNTMTVKAAAVVINTLTTPAAQTVVKGIQKHLFAVLSFDANNSGEDVRITNVTLTNTESDTGGSVASTSNNIDNAELWANLTGGSALDADRNGDGVMESTFETRVADAEQFVDGVTGTAGAVTLAISLDQSFVVPKSQKVEVGVFADISSSSEAGDEHTIKASAGSAVGSISGISVTPTVSGTGQKMTVANAGSFTVTLDPSSPSTQLAIGGTNNVTLAVVKVRPTNEDIDLEDLYLQLTAGTAASLSGNTVKVLKNGVQVGTGVFSGTSATVTFSPKLRIVKDQDTKLSLVADLARIGTNQPGVAGASVKVDYDGGTLANTNGTGVDSGTTINSSSGSDTASNGVVTLNSKPTVAVLPVPNATNLTNGTVDLFRFSVSADANGNVSLGQLNFLSTGTGVTYTGSSAKLIAYSDSGFSQPIPGFASGEVFTGGSIVSATQFEIDLSSTPVSVPAGSTYYFKFVSDVSGVAPALGDSISTKLIGDAAPVYTSAQTFANADADANANNDFIWSGNSFGTPTAASVDWYNGFSVQGLPASDTDAVSLTTSN